MAQDTAVKRGHKIPVPSNYRNAAKYVQIAKEEKRNIMPLLEQDKHFRAGRTVVGRVLNNMPIIDLIYNELDLATKEPRIKQWLAKVMIAEVLFGNGRLVGNSRPVESMKVYVDEMHMLLDRHMKDIKKNEEKFKGWVAERRALSIRWTSIGKLECRVRRYLANPLRVCRLLVCRRRKIRTRYRFTRDRLHLPSCGCSSTALPCSRYLSVHSTERDTC
uniref:Uncharacterized protein n=1 Tax=Anopheles funestus TaxID=62324 RepID=A0A182R9G8_ANOFN